MNVQSMEGAARTDFPWLMAGLFNCLSGCCWEVWGGDTEEVMMALLLEVLSVGAIICLANSSLRMN